MNMFNLEKSRRNQEDYINRIKGENDKMHTMETKILNMEQREN